MRPSKTLLSIGIVTALVVRVSYASTLPVAGDNPCLEYGLNSPYPQTPIQNVPYPVLVNFHQRAPLLVDPEGDQVLFALAKVTLQRIIWMTEKKTDRLNEEKIEALHAKDCASWYFGADSVETATVPPQVSPFVPTPEDVSMIDSLNVSDDQKDKLLGQLARGELSIDGRRRPLNNSGMQRMFARVIQQEYEKRGIHPTVGEFHRWSDEFLGTQISEFVGSKWPVKLSKLLAALSKGVTGRFMTTGTEEMLQSWILDQPLDSIRLPEIFRKSYQLNQGNIYFTLLAIENVLARDWRVTHRENLPVTQRLTRITHEVGSAESRFGNWYHFFGITLYGYVNGEISALSVAETEVLGSIIMNHFQYEKQKHSLNRNGALIGHALMKLVKNEDWKTMDLSDDALEASSYLNPSEDFSKKMIKRSEKIGKENK